MAGTVKRTGLQRLICSAECGAILYGTLAQIREGLPSCRCGQGMVPENCELAAEILPAEAWGNHPWLREFDRECNSVLKGQTSHMQRGRKLRHPTSIAEERVAKAMAEEARARRLAGLRQFAREPEAMPF